MKQPSDQERLLGEILAEAEPDGFRAALLNETLQLAGRRRRLRRFRQSTAAVAAGALGILLASRMGTTRQDLVGQRAPACATVRTERLPASAVIRTQPLDRNRIVASTAGVEVVGTTAASGRVRVVGDAELLALTSPRAAVLVQRGPHSAELIFTQPDSRDDAPVN